MKQETLAVIMPVYNEEEIIHQVVLDWTTELDDLNISYQIHLYNDGSRDNTLAELELLAKKYKDVFVHDKENSGHGPTILLAYNDLNDKYDWIFQTDSDNELPAKYFKHLWERRENHDFLIGYRDNRDQPAIRNFVSRISRMTIGMLYSYKVKDVNSPYRLMKADKFGKIFTIIPQDTFAPNIIISGYAGYKRYNIFQYPVPHQNRQTGTVSIKKFKLLRAAIKSYIQTIRFRFSLSKGL